jgi:dihydropteroate synthase
MHMQGEPLTMQQRPGYADVVAEVRDFFGARVAAVISGGVMRDRLMLDPGFGFGKALEHNLTLLRHLPELSPEGLPLLVGVSRKSMLGAITGRAVEDRLPASLAAVLLAVQRGASILRVHDVAATRDVLAVWKAIETA